MKPARELLSELASRGVTVKVIDGANLSIRPRTAVDDRLLAEVRGCKSELLEVLAEVPRQGCPPLPKGVRAVRYQLKTPPVAIDVCSIITDVDAFVRAELRELDARLHSPVQIRGGWGVFAILERLRQAGLELEILPQGPVL